MTHSLKKQCLIEDLLSLGNSIRRTAKLAHVEKSTVQDYKKNGAPYLRKLKRNPNEKYPSSWPEERKWFIGKIEEVSQINSALINQQNKDKIKIQDLTETKEEKEKQYKKLNKKIEVLEKENQEKIRQVLDILQKNKEGAEKIETVFSELLTDKNTWVKRCIDLSKIVEDNQKNHSEEKPEQTSEPLQETQAIEESGDESSTNNDRLFWFAIGTYGAGKILPPFITYMLNKPTMPTAPTRTQQSNLPLKWYYDQEKEIWILQATNGGKIIPDSVISNIQKIKNQKITNVGFFVSESDQPINSNTKYITVAYGKYASYDVPLSPERMIQPGPIRISPCGWYPHDAQI